jgi:hypothetical protein
MRSAGALKALGWTLLISSSAVLLLAALGEYYAADICLDAGKVYDYATSQCRGDVDHLPYVSFIGRVGWPLLIALGGFVSGIGCTVAAYRKRQ